MMNEVKRAIEEAFPGDYLSKPYLVYDPKDNHKLITKKDHD
jgi:hypothetical protein